MNIDGKFHIHGKPVKIAALLFFIGYIGTMFCHAFRSCAFVLLIIGPN